MEKELTPKQQTSEAVRQAETILIMTAQRPTIDQVASTLALTQILRKFGKKVTAVISDDVPAGAKFLPTNLLDRQLGGLRDFIIHVDTGRAEVDTLRYDHEDGQLNVHVTPYQGGFSQRDVSFSYGDYHYDLVIILGVASYGRIDRIYTQDAEKLSQTPLVNIDFHRSNEQYGAINLIEPSAASLAEILIALSESLQTGLIDGEIASTMLAGIVAATDRFTASHTTAKTLTVAAQMMAGGGDHAKVIRGLYKSDRANEGRDGRPSGGQAQPSQPKMAEKPKQPTPPAPRQRQEVSAEPVSLREQPQQPQHPEQPQQLQQSERLAVLQAERERAAATIEPTKLEEDAPRNSQPAPEAVLSEESLPFPEPAPMASPLERPTLHPQSIYEPALDLQPAVEPPYDDEDGNDEQADAALPLEDLLPPQHIEPEVGPEPLINQDEAPKPPSAPGKAPNPINNPNFYQSVDKKTDR